MKILVHQKEWFHQLRKTEIQTRKQMKAQVSEPSWHFLTINQKFPIWTWVNFQLKKMTSTNQMLCFSSNRSLVILIFLILANRLTDLRNINFSLMSMKRGLRSLKTFPCSTANINQAMFTIFNMDQTMISSLKNWLKVKWENKSEKLEHNQVIIK